MPTKTEKLKFAALGTISLIGIAEIFGIGTTEFASGKLVIPAIDMSLIPSGDRNAFIEISGEATLSLSIPPTDAASLMERSKSFPYNQPAIANVRFKRTLLGRAAHVEIVSVRDGWIRTPK